MISLVVLYLFVWLLALKNKQNVTVYLQLLYIVTEKTQFNNKYLKFNNYQNKKTIYFLYPISTIKIVDS